MFTFKLNTTQAEQLKPLAEGQSQPHQPHHHQRNQLQGFSDLLLAT